MAVTEKGYSFPAPYTKLLLVEGATDADFIYALTGNLRLKSAYWVYDYRGKDSLHQALELVVRDTRFEELRHLSIIRDAEFDTDAFGSVCDLIRNANRINPRNQLAVPVEDSVPAGEEPKTSVLILSGEGVEGMIEDLVLDAYDDDPIMPCVDSYFSCLEDSGISLKREVKPKARTRVFIAGKNVDDRSSGDDSEDWELRYVFKSSWWAWDSPVFDPVKAFLRQLATT